MDTNIAKNLSQLLRLQVVDIQLDDIIKLRGSLPQEVISLEVELTTLEEQVVSTKEIIDRLEATIREQKVKVKEKESLIQKYLEQQMNVRNNREYDAITKEIELNKLDIQLAEKTIRTSYEQLEKNKHIIERTEGNIKKSKDSLTIKKEELTAIISVSEREEQELHKKRQKVIEGLDASLYILYEKIQRNMHNKLAVVVVKRNACGGCCIIIPPQTRIEIQEKNKINTCEHCSRIIADVDETTAA